MASNLLAKTTAKKGTALHSSAHGQALKLSTQPSTVETVTQPTQNTTFLTKLQ